MSNPLNVAVIGGGIIGMATALNVIDEFPGFRVSIIAKELTPDTTGDGSAGFWNPFLLGETNASSLRFWCKETFQYLLNIWKSEDGGKCGVGLLSGYNLSEDPMEDPIYSDVYVEYRDMNEKEYKMFPEKYKYGKFFTSVYAECSKLLPHMMHQFTSKGGKIIKCKVHSISELIGQYDVVFNCTGVEAAHLVPDPEVQPIRGQVIKVKAPWIKHAVTNDDFYILPNTEIVVCGGTQQVGDWNKNVDPEDSEKIWRRCTELVPSLKNAIIVKEWVGLRPGRSKPRIESEVMENSNAEKLLVIHNYGHGGSGVTLFWGCAKNAVQLLKDYLQQGSFNQYKSRL